MWVELCLFTYAKPAMQIRIGFNWYCLGILLLRILPWCLTEMIRIIVVLIFFFYYRFCLEQRQLISLGMVCCVE